MLRFAMDLAPRDPKIPGLALPVHVEGIDGSGKSTLIETLQAWPWPQESRIRWTAAPVSWPSDQIYRCRHLAQSLGGWADVPSIGHLLDFCGTFGGNHVLDVLHHEPIGWVPVQLHDRGPLSCCAYQRPRAIIRDQLLGLIPCGAVTVILDVPVELAAERRRARAAAQSADDEDRDSDLAPVREAYLRLAREVPDVHVLDGTRPTEDLAATVRGLVFKAAPAWRAGLRSQRLR